MQNLDDVLALRNKMASSKMSVDEMERILSEGVFNKLLELVFYDSAKHEMPRLRSKNLQGANQQMMDALKLGGTFTVSFSTNRLTGPEMDTLAVYRPWYYSISVIDPAFKKLLQ
jgi:hypothetical protein